MASSTAVTGSPSSPGPLGELPASARAAAQAASISSEVRRPARAARNEKAVAVAASGISTTAAVTPP